MSTFAVELSTELAEKLQREAERQGLRVEDILRKLAEDHFARDRAFTSAAEHVLRKNADLYLRLAK